jgi:hypothetical protein
MANGVEVMPLVRPMISTMSCLTGLKFSILKVYRLGV